LCSGAGLFLVAKISLDLLQRRAYGPQGCGEHSQKDAAAARPPLLSYLAPELAEEPRPKCSRKQKGGTETCLGRKLARHAWW
jgi:hypothetical protein